MYNEFERVAIDRDIPSYRKVGVNDSWYRVVRAGRVCPVYRIWSGFMTGHEEVCCEWYSFTKFQVWFDTNSPSTSAPTTLLSLDGSYTPETCVVVLVSDKSILESGTVDRDSKMRSMTGYPVYSHIGNKLEQHIDAVCTGE